MYLYSRDIALTPGILAWGSWEPETIKSLEEHLRPGMNFVDVGANIGYFSIIGHKIVRTGGGQTWAFEANPILHEFLADKFELNWFFGDAFAINKAAFSTTTSLTFYAPDKHVTNGAIAKIEGLERVRDSQREYIVDATTLDDFFTEKNIRVDFVKIDVEGSEWHVLEGARCLLNANPFIKILMEWSPSQLMSCGTPPGKLASLVEELGLSCEIAEGERRAITPSQLLDISSTTMVLLRKTI